MLVVKGIGAVARLSISIGGYGSWLKAGTTNALEPVQSSNSKAVIASEAKQSMTAT
jgi:hypothetical protein